MGRIHDVASMAGVSPTTVSMVLNNRSGTGISAATSERVLAAARKLGYRPNPYARALVGSRAPLVKLVYRPHEMYMGNLKGASLLAELRSTEREIMLTDSPSARDRAALVETLLWGQPEAVVFQYVSSGDSLGEVFEDLHREEVHCVIADCWELPDPKLPCDAVSVDRQAGVALGVEHLYERGHRQIGLLMTEAQFGRREAYESALDHLGVRDRYIRTFSPAPGTDQTREAAIATGAGTAAAALLDEAPKMTALVCGSDMIALGAMRAAGDAGRVIPRDLALVGFHNEPWTELLEVPLTTVAEPVAEICRTATDILRARLDGDSRPWQRVSVIPDLLIRHSTEEGPQCAEASP